VKSGARRLEAEALSVSGRATFGVDEERVGRLKSELKVDMAVDMNEVCVRVCAEGIKSQNPNITDEELIEKLQERLLREALAETQKIGGVSRLEAFRNPVQRLVKGLESVNLEYAFTGALAASFYGLPRTTTEVDVSEA